MSDRISRVWPSDGSDPGDIELAEPVDSPQETRTSPIKAAHISGRIVIEEPDHFVGRVRSKILDRTEHVACMPADTKQDERRRHHVNSA
jgi:hypothetical protein